MFLLFDSLGVSRNVVFTTFVTIFIFILGFIINRMYERYLLKKHLKEVRSFVSAYLRNLENPIEKQVAAFKKFAGELASLKHQDMIFQEDTIRSDYLKSVSQLDVFKALVFGRGKKKKNRIQNLNLVLEALDFIERLRKIAKLNFNYLTERYKSYLQNWNDSIDSILRHYDSFRSEATRTNTPLSQDSFLHSLDRLISAWQELDNRDDFKVELEMYVHPIKRLCKDYNSDPRAVILLPLTLKASFAFNNRKNLLESMAKFFRDEAAELAQNGTVIKKALQCFQ